MNEKSSILQASDLINSALYAKGYFNESESLQKLKFSTTDEINEDEVYSNDKLIINTIYQLLQELDKSKLERENLSKQLIKKDENIKSLQSKIDLINLQNEENINKFKQISNNYDILLEENENLIKENKNFNKLIEFEKKLNNSLKKKYETNLNKKEKLIKYLQDRIILKNNRIKNSGESIDDTKIILLQNEIENLSIEQEKLTIFLNFLLNYLNLLNNNKENLLKSTPNFYFENFENNSINFELIPINKIKELIFKSLDDLYNLINSNDVEFKVIKNPKVLNLENEIKLLKDNLNSALETNEKWSAKFQSMNKV